MNGVFWSNKLIHGASLQIEFWKCPLAKLVESSRNPRVSSLFYIYSCVLLVSSHHTLCLPSAATEIKRTYISEEEDICDDKKNQYLQWIISMDFYRIKLMSQQGVNAFYSLPFFLYLLLFVVHVLILFLHD